MNVDVSVTYWSGEVIIEAVGEPIFRLTPDEARELADKLKVAATDAEANQ